MVSTASTAFVSRKAGAGAITQRGILVGRTAQCELIELFAAFIDAEYADMADMMVSAGIHAARDVDSQVANVVHAIHILKALINFLGDGYGAGIGQRAIIQARAGDDVRHAPDIRRGQVECRQFFPQASRSVLRTSASTRFCRWLTRSSPKLYSSARSATASICAAVMSPGGSRRLLSEILTMA